MSPFETRKSVHINLSVNTHTEFKVFAHRKGLSMQEIFEELAISLIEGDNSVLKIVEGIKAKKIERAKRISASDADTIYGVIEEMDPFGRKE